MTSTDGQQILETLVATCLERQETHGDWQLDDVCRDHPDYRDRVSAVLLALSDVGLVDDEPASDTFGDFRLLRELGRGAMGVVHLAEQVSLGRRVALKRLNRGGSVSARGLERFRREAETLGQLDHPHVATVYDAGDVAGEPYIAMRYVDGCTLAEHIAERRRPANRAETPQILGWIESLARALHAAHDRGLVHRDVKPGNVLLDGAGQAVLVDFGLARLTQDVDSDLTRSGDSIGTPAYMAPEQIDSRAVGPWTDVYGLATTAFECLAGAMAFEADSREALYRAILRGDRRRLRHEAPAVTRDVAAVLDRAMAPKISRRFATCAEFADELARIREHRPIRTRRPSAARRSLQWSRRNPAAATWLLATTPALVIALGLLARIREQAEVNETERIAWAARETVDDKVLQAQLFREALRANPENSTIAAALQAAAGQVHELARVSDLGDTLRRVVWQGNRILAAGDGIPVTLFDATGRRVSELLCDGDSTSLDARARPYTVDLSLDGRLAAVGYRNARLALFDAATGQQRLPSFGREGAEWTAHLARFMPDSQSLVLVNAGGTMNRWTIDGELICDFRADHDGSMTFWTNDPSRDRPASRAHPNSIWDLAITANGETLITGGGNGGNVSYRGQEYSIRLWNKHGHLKRAPIEFHTDSIWDIECTETRFATASADGQLALWDLEDLSRNDPIESWRFSGQVYCLAFDASGETLAAGTRNGTIACWDARKGKRLWQINTGAAIHQLRFAEDGALFSAGWDRSIEVRRFDGRRLRRIEGHSGPVMSFALASSAGKRVASVSQDGSMRISSRTPWAVKTEPTLRTRSVARTQNGGLLLVESNGVVKLWDPAGREIAETKISGPIRGRPRFATNDARVLITTNDGSVWSWDLTSTPARQLGVPPVAKPQIALAGASPGEYYFVMGNSLTAVVEADLPNYTPLIPANYDGRLIADACLSPDGRAMLLGMQDGALLRYRLGERESELVLDGLDNVRIVEWTQDGVLVGTRNGKGMVLDPVSLAPLSTIATQGAIRAMDFDLENRRVLTMNSDGTLQTWSFPAGQREITLSGTTAEPRTAILLPATGEALSLSFDGELRWWSLNPEDIASRIGSKLPELQPSDYERVRQRLGG